MHAQFLLNDSMIWYLELKQIQKAFRSRRALAPVIANLLLIALAVVGGTITVVYAQSNFISSQVSGYPDIDFIQIVGYDTRVSCTLIFSGGLESPCGIGGLDAYGVKSYDERIAVYIVNHSSKKVLLSDVMFGGIVYSSTNGGVLTVWDDSVDFVPGQFAIMDNGNSLLIAENLEIQAGQTVTVVLDLESSFKVGRTAQMRITTGNSAVYVADITIGEHKLG